MNGEMILGGGGDFRQSDTDPAPKMDVEGMLRELVIPRLERLDEEREWYRDTLKRIERLCMETLAEVARKDRTP